jgi:Lon protease-like protein
MSNSTINIPLFPLNTVLFPQGLMPLRVFEIHYLDMVRDCLRNNTPFGVVNIVRGDDINDQDKHLDDNTKAIKHTKNTKSTKITNNINNINNIKDIKGIKDTEKTTESIEPLFGTLATIVDFDMLEPTILLIAAKGGERFKVLHTHTQLDGLLRADVTVLPSPIANTLDDPDQACVLLLKRIIEELEVQHKDAAEAGQRTFCFPIEKPYQFDDTAWIAHRFAEIMPISLKHKQLILSLPDAQARLNWVVEFLKTKEVV